ncbi:hypothetical protein M413DRAFT_448997 [Hebeloma cylindrosporum]|uniref:Uncharacterized protein n=1 Tax=Hebeloma cylindrosporum TaxID=76867 RepID=A0A0C2XFG1_HEBCY|nr:hypothetical protein M413DRAFT_448997 [Hebeloma cylindrosporum h7]
MMYRISSMYNHARKIIVLLLSAYVIEVVAIIVVSLCSSHFGTIVVPPPGVHSCKNKRDNLRNVVWLIVLGLAVKVALHYFYPIRQMHMLHRSSLAYVLLRDSVVFPLIAMLICIINIISSFRLSYFTSQLTRTFSTMFPVVLGCRLILNLRESYYQPFTGEMTLNRRNEPNYDEG